jgi:hypothetical protein
MTWRRCIIALPDMTEHSHDPHDLHDGRRVHVLTPGERIAIRKVSDPLRGFVDSPTMFDDVIALSAVPDLDDTPTVNEHTPETVKIPGLVHLCETARGR